MGGLFDVVNKEKRIKELEIEMQQEDFWNDIDKSNKINKELSLLKKELSTYNKLSKDIKDNKEIIELLELEYS